MITDEWTTAYDYNCNQYILWLQLIIITHGL